MAIIDNGEVLMEGNPQSAVDGIAGRIWKKAIDGRDLESHGQRCTVISTHLLAGRTQVRVYAPSQPDRDFTPAEPDLEDVYFLTLNRSTAAGLRVNANVLAHRSI